MNDNHQIAELAAPLLGTLTSPESELLALIINAVQEELTAQLRPNVDPADCAESLNLATVLLSVSAMRQLRDSDISDFTAGTLKVSLRNDRSAYAEMANRLLAPWRADAFAFRGVSG
ncbi:MAG: hypothetical protein IJJ99_03400 [Oscillospiraceae bacterium]|nr:hypothetical protein [Oscillospiraceae bacterium]